MGSEFKIKLPTLSVEDEILPAFQNKNIPVVLSSSNFYVPYCSVTIRSILDHLDPRSNYDIFILTSDITDTSKEFLTEMIAPYGNVSLRLINVEKLFEQYQLHVYTHITKETYFRLVVPWVFRNYDRVVFLDSDMVVCTDIAELLRLPLEGYYFAAAIEIVMAGLVNGFAPHMRDYLENTLQLDYRDYVNAGLMVFNCESMRRDFTSTQLLEDAAKKQYMIVDQDALNTSCRGRIFKLGVEWNLPTDAPVELQGPCARKSDYIKCAPEDLREQYRQAHENPKVIHYTDKGKPWLLPEEDLADVFWDTARRTPFYETILFRLLDFQTRTKAESIQLPEKPVQYYPQGKLFKRTVKRVVRIFLPYGTKRRAFVKKYYFKLRGWSIE